MEEFDYIGTGGFVIECSDGILGVFPWQAELMKKGSPYFETCFLIEMAEQQNCTLHKPDWTVVVAEYVVKMLVEGCIHVYAPEILDAVFDAADQVLVDLRLCDYERGGLVSANEGRRVVELCQFPEVGTFTASVTRDQWLQLLQLEVLLIDARKAFRLRTAVEGDDPIQSTTATEGGQPMRRQYKIHGKSAMTALLKIRDVLKSAESEPTDFSKESASVRAFNDEPRITAWQPPTLSWTTVSYKALEKYNYGTWCCGFAVSASPDVLMYLCEYTGMTRKLGSAEVSICHPTPQTLNRLLTVASTLNLNDNSYDIRYTSSVRNVEALLEKLTNCTDVGIDAKNELLQLEMDKENPQKIHISCKSRYWKAPY